MAWQQAMHFRCINSAFALGLSRIFALGFPVIVYLLVSLVWFLWLLCRIILF